MKGSQIYLGGSDQRDSRKKMGLQKLQRRRMGSVVGVGTPDRSERRAAPVDDGMG